MAVSIDVYKDTNNKQHGFVQRLSEEDKEKFKFTLALAAKNGGKVFDETKIGKAEKVGEYTLDQNGLQEKVHTPEEIQARISQLAKTPKALNSGTQRQS